MKKIYDYSGLTLSEALANAADANYYGNPGRTFIRRQGWDSKVLYCEPKYTDYGPCWRLVEIDEEGHINPVDVYRFEVSIKDAVENDWVVSKWTEN